MSWYFAYGSNMQRATFRGRRGIEPTQARAGRLEGWQLVFDKPPLVPIGEGFANIIEEAAASVFGVLFEITEDDLAHIDLTEGVLIGNYARIAVTVTALDDDATIDAFTLVSARRDPTLLPSMRYRALLVEGAVEHHLPPAYLEWLRSVPAGEETPEAVRLRPFIDDALRRPR